MSLSNEFLVPDYTGGSIANVPATIASFWGVPFQGLPPLRKEFLAPLAGNVQRVVVFIVDAFGWNLLTQEKPALHDVLKQTAVTGQLTSIFPSTTTAALTSLWTGVASGHHGFLGYRLFLSQYATTAQMIQFMPAFEHAPDALVRAGLNPEEFLQVPGLAQQLAAGGIPTYSFKAQDIIHSALSKMHRRGVAHSVGCYSSADLMVQLRTTLEKQAGQPLYANAYWSSIDGLSHMRGWTHGSVVAELRALFFQLQTEFLQALSPAAKRDTLFVILADHGQVVNTPNHQIRLADHPQLRQMMFMEPAGEPRMLYVYAKHGRQADILAYCQEHLSHALMAVPTADALAMGLFGPPPHHPAALERIGDILFITRDNYAMFTGLDRAKVHEVIGWHGSLTPAEMQVPWLAFRLDG